MKITSANVEKIIKSINQRIADIGYSSAQGFGDKSALYEKYEKAINKMLPESLRGESKNGMIKIANTKESRRAFTEGDFKGALNRLYNYETKGQNLEKTKQRLRSEKIAEGEKKPKVSKEEIYERTKTNRNMKWARDSGKWEEIYAKLSDEDLAILGQKHNTWEEINAIFGDLFEDAPFEEADMDEVPFD